MPMIFETSVQTRFLIPMAISLGFGILFATVLILLVVPSVYLIVEDMISAVNWMMGKKMTPQSKLADVQLEEVSL